MGKGRIGRYHGLTGIQVHHGAPRLANRIAHLLDHTVTDQIDGLDARLRQGCSRTQVHP